MLTPNLLRRHREVAAGGGWSGANNITRSAWFDGSADYMNRTFGTPNDQSKWIYSVWLRRVRLGTIETFFIGGTSASGSAFYCEFQTADTLEFTNGTGTAHLVTNRLFRDTEWFHVLFSYDSDDGTAGDRMQLWVNGVEETSFSTDVNPSLGLTSLMNSSGANCQISGYNGATGAFKGSMAQACFLDGVSIQNGDHVATEFGEEVTVGTNGTVWAPLADSALIALADTVGGNSFCLTTVIGDGTDGSTNGNDLTPTSMSDAANGSTDVPSDPNSIWAVAQGGSATFSEGGAKCLPPYSGTDAVQYLTIPVPATGKYYIELAPDEYAVPGLFKQGELRAYYPGYSSGESFGWHGFSGALYQNAGTLATLNTYASGTRIMLAIDADNGDVYLGKAGTWEGSADPDAGTGAQVSGLDFLNDHWVVAIGTGANPSATATEVFSHADDFSHTVPTDYLALRLSNAPAPAEQGIDLFNAVTYTGDGVAIGSGGNAVTGAGFQPDFVWVKNRASSFSHGLSDSSRGPNQTLFSDLTAAEGTYTEKVDSFDADGFTHGNDAGGNENTSNIVAWCWKLAEGTETTNNDGNVASEVQVADGGFMSIARYVGDGLDNRDIGHGLDNDDVAVIVKDRDAASSWIVSFPSMTDNQFLQLESNTAVQNVTSGTVRFHRDNFTASTFQVGTYLTTNTRNFIAYVFKNVPGLCGIGKYTGNGSADGPYIPLGFQPRWIMVKSVSSAHEWTVYDSARETFNDGSSLYLHPDTSGAEGTDYKDLDILAQGFKARDATANLNTNGGTYLYIAIAEVASGVGLPPIPGR